jgi:predicted Zn-dependent protease with MMP-like domain
MFRVATSPSEIVIYAQALTRSCGDDTQRLRAAVEETVLHELGHYFGLTHAEMGAHLHV